MSDPTTATEYQCPGETYMISQSVHLGRMASFHPGCRQCQHNDRTATLSPSYVQQFAETQRRADNISIFTDVGVSGVYRNQIDVTTVRRLAIAMGLVCCDQIGNEHRLPNLVLASDERPEISELVAVASEGLRRTGCEVTDIGGATAACTRAAIMDLHADGGLMVGNRTNDRKTISLRFWSSGPFPVTRTSGLLEIERLYDRGIRRGVRQMGPIQRVQVESKYLQQFAPLYHALRPLRLIVETASAPLRRYWSQLSASVGCDIRWINSEPHQQYGSEQDGCSHLDLNKVVPQENAHFGMTINGDGAVCTMVDEQGDSVSLALLGDLLNQTTEITTNVFQTEEGSGELDGIASISSLLRLLSRDDRPLSRVLDESCSAGYDLSDACMIPKCAADD